jgi:predicted ATPase with chaperone activity
MNEKPTVSPLYRVQSTAAFVITAYPISVEIDVSPGQHLDLMTIGLPDMAVRESRGRAKVAVHNRRYPLLPQRTTMIPVPANVKKEGSAKIIAMASIRSARGKPPHRRCDAVSYGKNAVLRSP